VSAPTFKPSAVVLTTPPFTGTFRKTEIEIAAGLIVCALAHTGDTWRALPARELGATLERLLSEAVEPIKSWARNPFMRPDFAGLVAGGFATRGGDDGNQTLELTPAAFEALKRWVP
jgi:hypothetical protein